MIKLNLEKIPPTPYKAPIIAPNQISFFVFFLSIKVIIINNIVTVINTIITKNKYPGIADSVECCGVVVTGISSKALTILSVKIFPKINKTINKSHLFFLFTIALHQIFRLSHYLLIRMIFLCNNIQMTYLIQLYFQQ